jgi:hypothetical protein
MSYEKSMFGSLSHSKNEDDPNHHLFHPQPRDNFKLSGKTNNHAPYTPRFIFFNISIRHMTFHFLIFYRISIFENIPDDDLNSNDSKVHYEFSSRKFS